jgi:16S rRNA C967 or C1407 C5-methylase (RsmB/RsmF family)
LEKIVKTHYDSPMPHPHGQTAFIDYYFNLFADKTVFKHFLTSLEQTTLPILRFNPANTKRLQQLWQAHHLDWHPLAWYPYAVQWPQQIPFGETLPGFTEHLIYPMNASSLLPVLALNPQPGETVLDACAAPGGKALMIAEQIGATGTLLANDICGPRRQRMATLFADWQQTNITIINKDAAVLFKHYKHQFDKILVDAPCSSEKHVWNSPKHLADWSYSRIKQLKQRQLAILSGLTFALKPGGTLVYSTCAINTEENEGVVAQLLKKRGDMIALQPWTLSTPGQGGLPGNYVTAFDVTAVRRILPHHEALDPMFVAVFRTSP